MLVPPKRLRDRPRLLAAVVVALALLVAAGLFVLYARGGGPVPAWFPVRPAVRDLLGPSDPAEAALRAMRLAGFERAVAGDERGTALLRVEVPDVASAAELEIAWQASVAALAESYPDSDRYVVQLFAPDAVSLVEVEFDGAGAREAVAADDAAALRVAAKFTFLSEEGGS